MDRNEAIREIKQALRARSDRTWSVRGGRGTSWGWIKVTAPPARLDQYGGMTDADRDELSRLLGKPVHHQGEMIPSGSVYRREYVARARGEQPAVLGTPYWD